MPFQFKELMNKIDPDDEEDEDGNPIDKSTAPVVPKTSFKTRGLVLAQQAKQGGAIGDQLAAQALMQQQNQQQQYLQNMQNHPLVQRLSSRPQRSSSSKKNHNDNYYSGMGAGMRLDPETGEMIPDDAGGEDDDGDAQVLNNEKSVVIKLGNLTSTQVCVCFYH